MEVRSIDAIVAMVSAGLGVSIVPEPRQALLEAHGVRALGLGRGGPTRQIAVVRRRADAANRNIDADVPGAGRGLPLRDGDDKKP